MRCSVPKAVLVQPPFFKLFGSHNDKVVPSLMFLGKTLENRGDEVVIVNADSSGASWYIPWRMLYQNFGYYVEAIERGSPLFFQTVEEVMSHRPDYVVVSAGCYLATTVDFGMPWGGEKVIDLLKRYGVKIYTYGPFWDEGQFGLPSMRDEVGIVYKEGIDLRLLPHGSKYDVVFSSVGCPYGCSFCLQPKYIAKRVVLSDEAIATQLHLEAHYIEDPIFDTSPYVMSLLRGRRYTVEARVDKITPQWIDIARQCGVERVKLGVESGSKRVLDEIIRKRLDLPKVLEIASLCQRLELDAMAFYVIGFPGETKREMEETIDFALSLENKYDVTPSLFIATPLPGTRLEEVFLKEDYYRKKLTSEEFSRMTGGMFMTGTREVPSNDLALLVKKFYGGFKKIFIYRSLVFLFRNPGLLPRLIFLYMRRDKRGAGKEFLYNLLQFRNCLKRGIHSDMTVSL